MVKWLHWLFNGRRETETTINLLWTTIHDLRRQINENQARCNELQKAIADHKALLDVAYQEIADHHKRIVQLEERPKPAEAPAPRRSPAAFRALMDSGGLGVKNTTQ